MFRMEIEGSGNAAFSDGGRKSELLRMLNDTIRKVEAGYEDGALMDINGNKCGDWWFDPNNPDSEDDDEDEES